ncbi:MAG: response regulator transcription factor [Rhodospirillaceae bacterium]|nr:response regulator transcription factor [Rhodospirillaceae bacterium]
MRILLVEDDASQADSLQLILKSESIDVERAGSGATAIEMARLYDYALVILDLMLPDMDGHTVLRRIRDARVTTPVLILTGLNELDHKVRGLGSGADDYLTKPFAKDELVARIHAIVRRSQGHAESAVNVGRLTVRLGDQVAEIDGEPVKLTGKEFGVLELLALRRGQTVSKNQFLNHLYGGMDEPDLKIIDVFVCKLRQKIARHTGGTHYIITEWGRGYALREDAKEAT